jgi:23S rRNA pseudouridine1911/1915/1917 synthase
VIDNSEERRGRDQVIELKARIEDETDRLDRYLGSHPDVPASRSKIQKLAADGYIMVAGRTVSANYKLKGGETIRITIPQHVPTVLKGEDLPLEILYEDDYLAVVNKPAGMVTHPGIGNRSGTLVNALIHHFDELALTGESERPGIVHRLDKDTTGLLVVAKTDEAFEALRTAIKAREIKRTYLALVCGHMRDETGLINLPVGRARTDRMLMRVTDHRSREAITEYRLLERFDSYDLLEVKLHTGRTHQIRVHFSHLGHPVFGDPSYGGRERWHKGQFAPDRPLGKQLLKMLPRQALHAKELSFTHPITHQEVAVTSNPPVDFQSVLDKLREQ